jgi:hypothetical protein
MQLNYNSNISYVDDEDNLCQLRFYSGRYISDDKSFELLSKVDNKIFSTRGDF